LHIHVLRARPLSGLSTRPPPLRYGTRDQEQQQQQHQEQEQEQEQEEEAQRSAALHWSPMSTPYHRLLDLVASDEGISLARACKRLALSRSELLRLLAPLGADASLGGLDLVRVEQRDGRETLWLTDRARDCGDAS
jgi:hypothetical protein